jgi:hypothetical protein
MRGGEVAMWASTVVPIKSVICTLGWHGIVHHYERQRARRESFLKILPKIKNSLIR